MLEQLGFYVKHSLNDMRVNGQRTFFALLCIAAGVAAIVSLQTLAVMIENALTNDLQRQNLGDIRAEFGGDPFGEDEGVAQIDPEQEAAREAAIIRDTQRGLLDTSDQGFFGVEVDVTQVTLNGVAAIEADLNERFGTAVNVTGNVFVADPGQVILGVGTGVSFSKVGTEGELSNTAPLVVDVDEYPYYDTVRLDTGETLQEAFDAYRTASGTDGSRGIVLSREAVSAYEDSFDVRLAPGDDLLINGAEGSFTLLGVVPTDTEIRDLASGFLLGFYGYYYYVDLSALQYFPDVPPLTDNIYIELEDPALLEDVAAYLADQYPYLELTTTEDVRQQNEDISEALDVVVTVMGLLSLLLGSIGIINTMQVVVRRRTVEIAVLKTLGLQGNNVTLLFLTQAFIMGVLGSIGGVFLGWGAVFVIRGAAESLLFQELGFTIALTPVLNGVIVGTLVTTVFGFLPTLSAAQVRPGVVLRPTDAVIPRTGLVLSLVSLLGMIFVLSFIAQAILGGNLALSFLAVAGSFVAAGMIFLLLYFVIWIVGRLAPSFGLPDMKISKRQMLATRSRGAITLLALVVAVFSLSTITLYAQSFTNLLDSLLNEEGTEPVIIAALVPGQTEVLEQQVKADPTVESYTVNRTFSDVELVSVVGEDGRRFNSVEAINEAAQPQNQGEVFTAIALETLGAVEQRQSESPSPLIEGVWLNNAPDTGDALPLVLTESDYTTTGVLALNDRITYRINGQEVTFQVIGLQELDELSFNASPASIFVRWDDMQALGLEPNDTNLSVSMPEDAVPALRSRLSQGVDVLLVIDARTFTNLIERLLDRFSAFPTMVALLGLVVGGVVIANSVALSTLERRKEIAVMKSVGLQRERVLGMILLENGLLGLVGGLVGVGSGLIALVYGSANLALPMDVVPFGEAALLMGLCILVAVGAALTTAWGASGEKPLNVLRYE